jgi:hypothetical protein
MAVSRSIGKRERKNYRMWRTWHKKLRARERSSIYREMMSLGYGDIVFPIVKEVSNSWDTDSYKGTDYVSLKQEIRDECFQDISKILNKHPERWYKKWWQHEKTRAGTCKIQL